MTVVHIVDEATGYAKPYPAIPHRFATADDAVAQLEREKFQRDGYDPSYPWRSSNGLVSARVRWDGQSYVIDCIA